MNYKHGMTKTATYHAWSAMKRRCYNKKHPAYKDYGGRGIRICKRWFRSFENFLEDMGLKPEGKSIDRRDNSLGYRKSNCRWRTQKDQCRNRRSNRLITCLGISQTSVEWKEQLELKLSSSTIRKRIKLGWRPFDAFFAPVQTKFCNKRRQHDKKGTS